jgi:hypothetical protein
LAISLADVADKTFEQGYPNVVGKPIELTKLTTQELRNLLKNNEKYSKP